MDTDIIKKLEDFDLSPGNVQPLKEIAYIYFGQQKYRQSIGYMVAALQFDQEDPDKGAEYRMLYQAHNKIGDYRRAKKYFETARAYGPMHPEVLRDLFEFYDNDWFVYIEDGMKLDELAIAAGVTYAVANNKKVVIFVGQDGKESTSFMVHKNSDESLISTAKQKAITMIEAAKLKKISMVCPEAKILPIA